MGEYMCHVQNRRPIQSAILCLGLLLLTTTGLAEPFDRATAEELVQELGSGASEFYEPAQRRLRSMGAAVAPVLREARADHNQDVRRRAEALLDELRPRMRQQIEQALDTGGYGAAIPAGLELIRHEQASVQDCLHVGHVCQLAGEWNGAVAAYRQAADRDRPDLRHVGKDVAARMREEGWSLARRTRRMRWIARIQRDEMGAPEAAVRTLSEAIDLCRNARNTGLNVTVTIYELLGELAIALEASGDLQGSIDTWNQFLDMGTDIRSDNLDLNRGLRSVAVERMLRCVRKLPDNVERPPTPRVHFIARNGQTIEFERDEKGRFKTAAYAEDGFTDRRFALAAPRGMETASLRIQAEIECRGKPQYDPLRVSLFQDYLPQVLDSVRIGNGDKIQPGRHTIEYEAKVPPGIGMVHLEARRRDAWLVGMRCTATLRPAPNGLKPHLTSALRDPDQPWWRDANGPFTREKTNLMLDSLVHEPHMSIQPVGDGEYLAIWRDRLGRLVSSRSRDLRDWSQPAALPFSSVFKNHQPATCRMPDGTIVLAFTSDRLGSMQQDVLCHLFATSTRDGRTWEPVRRIGPHLTVSETSEPSLAADAQGHLWVIVRNRIASGPSLGALSEFTKMTTPDGNTPDLFADMWGAHVLAAPGGRGLQLVFTGYGTGMAAHSVYGSSSRDGKIWSPPRQIVLPGYRGFAVSCLNPQVLRGKDATLLLYDIGFHTRIARMPEAGQAFAGKDGVGFVSESLRKGSRAIVRDGKVYMIAGHTDTRLLVADWQTLLDATAAETPAETQPAGEK